MIQSQITKATEIGTIKYSCGFLSRCHDDHFVARPGMKVWDLQFQYYDDEKGEYTGVNKLDSDIYIGTRRAVFTFDWQDFEWNYESGCIELYDGSDVKELFQHIVPQKFEAEKRPPRSPEKLTPDDFFDLLDWTKDVIWDMVCHGVNTGDWAYAAYHIVGIVENDMTVRLTDGKARSRRHATYLQRRIDELCKIGEKIRRPKADIRQTLVAYPERSEKA